MSTHALLLPVDRRITELRHLDLPYDFIPPRTKTAWQTRARALREHILVSLGLWPMPEKTPLNTQIFGRIERDEYTVEKVYFESLPGFFVTGNLYRPNGRKGPCPGVLNPHGHWRNGRLADEDLGSIPGRCIGFARQGCVAFSWDMIGYNDSNQITHRFGGPRELLWGISLMGLQLWNSIRAVDFLQSLSDVDPDRIACTGESGGGTQTFMLCAVDDRIILSAPVNMISGHMQGGCLCENGPNVRLDTNNIEIGAMMAPRPMLLISATGDWTVNTPTVEFPAIQRVYRLFRAAARVHHVQIDAGHNYNQASRNAVYAWFGKWLFGSESPRRFKERPFTAEKPEDLLVFTPDTRPTHAVDEAELVHALINRSETQLNRLKPKTSGELKQFQRTMGVAFRSAVGASIPAKNDLIVTLLGQSKGQGYIARRLYIGRQGQGDRVPAILYTPNGARDRTPAALVVHPDGKAGLLDTNRQAAGPLLKSLLQHGHRVLAIDAFLTGESKGQRDPPAIHCSTTYNRTDTSNRVQDVVTGLAYLRTMLGAALLSLVGLGEAGLWCLLARGIEVCVERTVIDAMQFDADDDQAYVDRLFIPCLRRAGDIRTAAALIAPDPLFIHNTGTAFRTDWVTDVYRATGGMSNLRTEKKPATTATIVKFLQG